MTNFDLYIAKWKASTLLPEKQVEDIHKKWQNQIQQDIQMLHQIEFAERSFFDGLFTMVLPNSLLEEKEELTQGMHFYSHKEKIALSLRFVENASVPEPEKLKTDYITKMKSSKQQTEIEEDGVIASHIGSVYYFLASHAMPKEKQYNFAVLFLAHGQTVIMDFSFCESQMMLWKVMLRRLIKTIR